MAIRRPTGGRAAFMIVTSKTTIRLRLHRGRGRKILPGQKIHASVPFCQESYVPKARPLDGVKWSSMVGRGRRQDMHWASHLGDVLEMDIFDHSVAQEVIEKLTSGPEEGAHLWLHRLAVMTWSSNSLLPRTR